MSVSDLFDISYYNCDDHEGHQGFTITIKSETIDQFVGLLHMHDGEWEIIEVSEVNEEDNSITFYIDELSPFAT